MKERMAGARPGPAHHPLQTMLGAVSALAGLVGDVSNLSMALGSVLEQMPSLGSGPTVAPLLTCLVAAANTITALMHAQRSDRGPLLSLRLHAHKMATLMGGSDPRVTQSAQELLLALLPLAGDDGLRGNQLHLLLSACWAQFADESRRSTWHSLQLLISELVKKARTDRGWGSMLGMTGARR